MTAMVNVNGKITDQANAVVSVFDHGFLYGEGVYETLRTYSGQPFLFDRHMRRLRKSASMLSLSVPAANEEIDRRFRETMKAAGLGTQGREAYLRILVTRGIGELTYDPAACGDPTIVIIAKPHVDPPVDAFERGVMVALVDIVRNHPGSVNPLIKSNNLLNNALAMQEAFRRGAFEGVMRNYRGELAECTTANLFVVKDGEALTPPLDAGLLAGITREYLFEAFLTSTTRELVPIVRVDNHTIGEGVPGPVTKGLLQAFRRKAHEGED
jgi:branched-chain amino acid aminotransferase